MGDPEQRQVESPAFDVARSTTEALTRVRPQPSSMWLSSSRIPPSWPKTTGICGSTTACLPVRPWRCMTARQTAAAAVSPRAVLINTTIIRCSSLGAHRRTAECRQASRTLLQTRRVGSYNGTSSNSSTPMRCKIGNPTLLTLPSRPGTVPSFPRACIRSSGRPASTTRRSRVQRCHPHRRGRGATRQQSGQVHLIRSNGR